jgi:hypothetical protein
LVKTKKVRGKKEKGRGKEKGGGREKGRGKGISG